MQREIKKFIAVLFMIGSILVFSFSPLPDCLHTVNTNKAPWLNRTQEDLIKDMRLEMFNMGIKVGSLGQENRILRGDKIVLEVTLQATIAYYQSEIRHLEKINKDLAKELFKYVIEKPDYGI